MIKFLLQLHAGRILRSSLGYAMLMLSALFLFATPAQTAPASFGDALYFSLTPGVSLPTAPSSILINSPTYIDVPAGAKLSVYLMRGETVISTSTLAFQNAYSNPRLLPARQIASFVLPGASAASSGQPLPGATLTAGEANLAQVTMEPAAYKVMWLLSAGVMDTPSQVIVTGPPTGLTIVGLKLSAVSAAMLAGDQKPGSVLFFNRYTSNAANTGREDTTFNLTNSNPATAAYVRLFLVSAATCQITELQVCLAPQQTVSYLMSDIDPGVKGYIIAVAVNLQGEPIQFNWLTGNAIIKQPGANIGGSYASLLSAVAIAKRKDGNVPNSNGVAEMVFDDMNYDRLPGQIAFDSVPSQAGSSNASLLSFYRPVSDLTGTIPSAAVQVTGWGKNNQGQVVSSVGNVSSACYSEVVLGTFRLQPTPINQLLPSGTTAWFAASSTDLQPLLGAQFNTGEFNSGTNARPLSFSSEYKIKIPVLAVTCPQ